MFSSGYESGMAHSIINVTGPSLSNSVVRKPHLELGLATETLHRAGNGGLVCNVDLDCTERLAGRKETWEQPTTMYTMAYDVEV